MTPNLSSELLGYDINHRSAQHRITRSSSVWARATRVHIMDLL